MARTFYGKILQGYRTLTGSYFSDAQGKLSNVIEVDVPDLVDGGCVDRDMATKAVLGGIAVLSGDAAKVLSGAGTFVTPAAAAVSAGSSGVVQKSDGSGGFSASSYTDDGDGKLTSIDNAEIHAASGSPASLLGHGASLVHEDLDANVTLNQFGDVGITLKDGGRSFSVDLGTGGGTFELNHATSTPGASSGTLTNAPAVGNPQTWLQISINGVTHWIPAWHA